MAQEGQVERLPLRVRQLHTLAAVAAVRVRVLAVLVELVAVALAVLVADQRLPLEPPIQVVAVVALVLTEQRLERLPLVARAS